MSDEKKTTSPAELLIVVFFVVSMLSAAVKGCQNASSDRDYPDSNDYHRLQ